MRTVKEITKTETKEVVNNFNLKEAFVLWKKTGKSGVDYLDGYTVDENGNKTFLKGFFNTNKENPKQPDITVKTSVNEGEQSVEVASLWSNVSETKGTKYLTGSTNDKEKLVAFYGKENQEARPYIKAYYKEDK